MAERYWSREEVEALIPILTEIMNGVKSAHAEATTVRERMHAEKQRIALSGGAMTDVGVWRDDRTKLERLTDGVRTGLNRIVELGGVPKDLALGLVDFIHLRDGHEVNLCWKHGETAIQYWHALDEGYTARKPL